MWSSQCSLKFLEIKFIQRHNNRFNELYTFPMSHLYIYMKTLTPSQLINLTAQTINSMFENWNQTMHFIADIKLCVCLYICSLHQLLVFHRQRFYSDSNRMKLLASMIFNLWFDVLRRSALGYNLLAYI